MERCIERTRYSQLTPKEMSVASFARTLCLSVRGTTMSRSRRKTPITEHHLPQCTSRQKDLAPTLAHA